MKNVVIGSVLGAIVFFLWGFVFWSLLPTGPMVFDQALDEEALASQLKRSIPQSGTYYVPDAGLMQSDVDEFVKRHQAGPVATIFIYPEGKPVMPPRVFILGFLGMLAATFFMALVLQKAGGALTTYGSRVCFVVLVGLIGLALSDLGPPVWYWMPWSLWVATGVFHVSGWLWVGLVLARFVRPSRANPA